MTGDPINLDGRRSVVEQREIELRRRPANSRAPSTHSPNACPGSLEDDVMEEPARTWVEVMEKWRFLLDRFAKTPEAGDERLQKLIKRALGDMERLRKREEQK